MILQHLMNVLKIRIFATSPNHALLAHRPQPTQRQKASQRPVRTKRIGRQQHAAVIAHTEHRGAGHCRRLRARGRRRGGRGQVGRGGRRRAVEHGGVKVIRIRDIQNRRRSHSFLQFWSALFLTRRRRPLRLHLLLCLNLSLRSSLHCHQMSSLRRWLSARRRRRRRG
jgi:hypothetical protein